MLITTKLIVVFLTISILPLCIFAVLIYLQTEQFIKNETLNNLSTDCLNPKEQSSKHVRPKR